MVPFCVAEGVFLFTSIWFCSVLVLLNLLVYNNFFVSEYKKAKQDLKKATAETNKWQKKVKKGELGEHNKLHLHLRINLVYLMYPSCLY